MGYGQLRFKRWVCSIRLRNPNPILQYLLLITALITLGQLFLIITSDKNDAHFPIRSFCIDKLTLWKIPKTSTNVLKMYPRDSAYAFTPIYLPDGFNKLQVFSPKRLSRFVWKSFKLYDYFPFLNLLCYSWHKYGMNLWHSYHLMKCKGPA